MDKDQFKELKGPLAEHRLRTNLYLRIMAESSSPWSNTINHEKATVLYISKGGWGCADPQLKEWGLKEQFSPFKEFEIARDDSQTDDLADRARTVKEFRAGKVGMPFGICATALVPRAMKCPLRAACFSRRASARPRLGRQGLIRMKITAKKSAFRAIGIDLSTKATGVVCLEENGTALPTLLIEQEVKAPELTGLDRSQKIVIGVLELIHELKPDRIVVEGYSLNLKNASSVVPLVEIGGLLRFMLKLDRLAWYDPQGDGIEEVRHRRRQHAEGQADDVRAETLAA